MDARHPTLKGRYLIRWNNSDGQRIEKWLPSLHEITLRKNDRVLILCPANWVEPIVIGMIDGFTPRPGFPRSTGPSITLLKDETIRVTDPDGKKLVEIHQDESGPVVQLFKDDITLDMPGKLCINAKTIELNAKKGDVKIKANDDIVVKGEVIHLN